MRALARPEELNPRSCTPNPAPPPPPPARAWAGRHHPGVVGEPAAGCIPPNRPKTTPMWPAGANEVRGAGLIRPSTGQRGASRLVEGAVFLVVVQPGSVRDAGSQRTSKQYTEAIRH
jgi:hypothetical protein